MDPSIKLSTNDEKSYHNVIYYWHLIGKLLYLTTIRPNITFAMQQLSQIMPKLMDYHERNSIFKIFIV
uniref:Retrovirus-related Pol polyprotein from transposon TNT 1-94 n=1 Tax=Cajanus cajan TaxID=3821 RepID=A0A151TPC7_CAJCA|nr:hypothetical protein KK1_022519 [Cajanus cajan]